MVPAEVFPLGVFVAEEIKARGWAADDLATRCSCPKEVITGLLTHPEEVVLSLREAEQVAFALEVNVALLLNLQLAYARSKN